MNKLLLRIILSVIWAASFPAYAQSDDNKGRRVRLQDNPDCSVWDDHSLPDQSVSWTGDCLDGYAHGTGIQVWRYVEGGVQKTQRYKGDIRFGKIHGRGVHEFASGNKYAGDYRNNKRNGRGVFTWADGNKYKGE